MEPAFEFRLVTVQWRGKDDPGRVEASHFPLTLKPAGVDRWTGDSVVYPKVETEYGQLVVGAPADGPPPALLIDGVWEPLHPVRDEKGQTWWIEKGKWDKKKGYHEAPLVNRAGTARFRVGDAEIVIDIAPSELTQAEFQSMLDEFRNGLWSLVLDRQSGAAASREMPSASISETFREAVHDLTVNVERVLRVPHVELREEETWSRPDRARPSARTFQALARKGAPRLVPGRGHAPSYDTAENRAAVAMTERVARTVEASARAVRGRANDLRVRGEVARTRLKKLDERPDQVWVPADRLRRDLQDVEAQAKAWGEAMALLTCGDHLPNDIVISARRTLLVDTPSADGRFSPYRVRHVAGQNGEPHRYSQVSAFVSHTRDGRNVGMRLLFDAPLDVVQQILSPGLRFRFDGELVQIGDCDPRKNTDWYTYRVVKMEPLPNAYVQNLRGLRQGMAEAERDGTGGFWRPLKTSERVDRDRERAAYRSEVNRFDESAEGWMALARELDALAHGLRIVLMRYKALGVRSERGAEERALASMVFVQNAAYRGVLAAYRRALAAAGLDASDVDRLLDLDDVGLLDLPTVYERWALVQLVRTLTEDLLFEMEESRSIVDALTAVRGRKTVAVTFSCDGYGRELDLSYQPWLQTSKGHRQPDYVLTLRRPADEEAPELDEDLYWEWSADSTESINERKLVIDAKFKPFRPLYGQSGAGQFNLPLQLDELLTEKDYCEDWTNRVFVLHPGPGGIDLDDVDRYTALGGEPVSGDAEARLPWDQERSELDERLDHDVGAVLLRPGERRGLRRLVLMHLYEGLQNTEKMFLESPELPPLCPSCGTPLLDEPELEYAYKNGEPTRPVRAVYTCSVGSCGHQSVRTYCANRQCGRHLWKLGPQWNYHTTRPMDPYDVKCPHCTTYRPLYLDQDDFEDE